MFTVVKLTFLFPIKLNVWDKLVICYTKLMFSPSTSPFSKPLLIAFLYIYYQDIAEIAIVELLAFEDHKWFTCGCRYNAKLCTDSVHVTITQ